jgi:hypothetical protein
LNRIDTLARVATALDPHLVVSFPEQLAAKLKMRFRSRDRRGDLSIAVNDLSTQRAPRAPIAIYVRHAEDAENRR